MGPIVMVVSHTLKIAIYVLKSVNGGLFYTLLYIHATFYHSGILKGCDEDYIIRIKFPPLQS